MQSLGSDDIRTWLDNLPPTWPSEDVSYSIDTILPSLANNDFHFQVQDALCKSDMASVYSVKSSQVSEDGFPVKSNGSQCGYSVGTDMDDSNLCPSSLPSEDSRTIFGDGEIANMAVKSETNAYDLPLISNRHFNPDVKLSPGANAWKEILAVPSRRWVQKADDNPLACNDVDRHMESPTSSEPYNIIGNGMRHRGLFGDAVLSQNFPGEHVLSQSFVEEPVLFQSFPSSRPLKFENFDSENQAIVPQMSNYQGRPTRTVAGSPNTPEFGFPYQPSGRNSFFGINAVAVGYNASENVQAHFIVTSPDSHFIPRNDCVAQSITKYSTHTDIESHVHSTPKSSLRETQVTDNWDMLPDALDELGSPVKDPRLCHPDHFSDCRSSAPWKSQCLVGQNNNETLPSRVRDENSLTDNLLYLNDFEGGRQLNRHLVAAHDGGTQSPCINGAMPRPTVAGHRSPCPPRVPMSRMESALPLSIHQAVTADELMHFDFIEAEEPFNQTKLISTFNQTASISTFNQTESVSTFNQPESGSTFNQTESLSTFNQPESGSTFNQPESVSTFNQTESVSTFNQTESVSAFNQTESVSAFNQPESGSTFNQPESGSTFNQPESVSTFNQTEQGSTFNQPESVSTLNQPKSVSAFNQPESVSTFHQPESVLTFNQPQTYTKARLNKPKAKTHVNLHKIKTKAQVRAHLKQSEIKARVNKRGTNKRQGRLDLDASSSFSQSAHAMCDDHSKGVLDSRPCMSSHPGQPLQFHQDQQSKSMSLTATDTDNSGQGKIEGNRSWHTNNDGNGKSNGNCSGSDSNTLNSIFGDDITDEKLIRLGHECRATGNLLPLTKYNLNQKIRLKLSEQGREHILEGCHTSTPSPVYELTAEEKERRERQKEQNRLAAKKCRDRKSQERQRVSCDLEVQEMYHQELSEEEKSLTREIADLRSKLTCMGVALPPPR